MKTKGQERAAFAYQKISQALEALGKEKAKEFASFVAGLPAMILQNGLGHTLCFLLAKDQNNRNTKHWFAFEAMTSWLAKNKHLAFEATKPAETIKKLTEKEALEYIALQEEALRFLEWFKVMSKMFVEEFVEEKGVEK